MSNINFGGWTVRYGCRYWSSQDESMNEREARKHYADYCKNPPVQGGHPAEYVILEDESGKIVESYGGR